MSTRPPPSGCACLGAKASTTRTAPEAGTLYLVDQHSRSWATLHITPEPPYQVRQSGQRSLWDEMDTAYRWWIDADQPSVEAWRFTVTASGQRVE